MEKILATPRKAHVSWQAPKPGCSLKIIGAGMPRTGTNSFCAAVSHLLNGPSYHVGVQTTSADETHVKNWISILGSRPYRPEDKKNALAVLKHELDGYVMAIDPPILHLVPELMEAFPDAIVICTMRDKKSWAVSFAKVIGLIKIDTMAIIFFWIRSLRLLPTMWHQFTDISVERHGFATTADDEILMKAWDSQIDWMKRLVPPEKLFFYDVREGWEPLCKILDVPVPKDMLFPRLNDAQAIEDAFKAWSIQGLSIWAGVVSVIIAVLSIIVYFLQQ